MQKDHLYDAQYIIQINITIIDHISCIGLIADKKNWVVRGFITLIFANFKKVQY